MQTASSISSSSSVASSGGSRAYVVSPKESLNEFNEFAPFGLLPMQQLCKAPLKDRTCTCLLLHV